jgi:hypothetical protein
MRSGEFCTLEASAGLQPNTAKKSHFMKDRYMRLMSPPGRLAVEERQEFHDLMELNESEIALSPPFTVGLDG